MNNGTDVTQEPQPKKRSPEEIRNLIGFWFLGLTNNFAYIVMLSCAHDILTPAKPHNEAEVRSGHIVDHCNPMGTGVVLLADILPALLMKTTAPIILQRLPYMIRVCCVVLFSLSSFILVSIGSNEHFIISIIGVICASSAYGLGETTYLGLISNFDKGMMSTWSSGTGAAGLLGTASYAGVLALGVSPRNYLIMMTVVPLLMAISYFLILTHPNRKLLMGINPSKHCTNQPITTEQRGAPNDDPAKEERGDTKDQLEVTKDKTFKEKMKILKPLSRYMVPLFFVYFFEYVINHALFELLQFDVSWMGEHEQYRWYLATFFLGSFFARSSVNIVHIKHTWVFPILQACVLTVLLLQIFFKYIPYIIIVFFIILLEGLLCGAGYVNTFYSILKYMDKEDHELGTSITCMGDSLGITLAALAASQIHNAICNL